MLPWLPAALVVLENVARLGLAGWVVYSRPPSGRTTAWALVILALPVVGIGAFVLVGENRLGARRARVAEKMAKQLSVAHHHLAEYWPLDLEQLSEGGRAAATLAEDGSGSPPLPGHRLTLYPTAVAGLDAMAQAIEAAEESVLMSFYIWEPGGRVDEVTRALVAAVQRGVKVQVLVDAVGSKGFLRHPDAQRLREAGVEVTPLLPVRAWRAALQRVDLRNHRKSVVIDGRHAFLGSLNMTDPTVPPKPGRATRKRQRIGPWVDVLMRVEGPAAEAVRLSAASDRALEHESADGQTTVIETDTTRATIQPDGVPAQVFPSGPGIRSAALIDLLATTIHQARESLTITTPYFVPDEATLQAILTAARRGVDVTLIVPKIVDSPLVRYAGTVYFDDLLAAGVKVARYTKGLLHAKTVTVDGNFALVGSVNMDMRSFFINFELTLLIYDESFTREVIALQQSYRDASEMLDPESWSQRSIVRRFAERFLGLFGPVL